MEYIKTGQFDYVWYKYETPITLRLSAESPGRYFKFSNMVPHNTAISPAYNENKKYDILFYGGIYPTPYPFRNRLYKLLRKNQHQFNILFLPYTKKRAHTMTTGDQLYELIDQSYLTISTQSTTLALVAKYIEIGLYGSVACGDYPECEPDLIMKQNMVHITRHFTDDQILTSIRNALSNKKTLEQYSNNTKTHLAGAYTYSAGLARFDSLVDTCSPPITHAICILVVSPNDITCEFISRSATPSHRVFILADDSSADLTGMALRYPAIQFIQVSDSACQAAGFVNANTWGIKKTPTAWDKAFYYFGHACPDQFEHVWMVEEDVFVPRPDAFSHIDAQYESTDLLTASHVCRTAHSEWAYWNLGDGKTADDSALFSSMVCACRLSRKMLSVIRSYAEAHRTLFYIEIMVNTLAVNAGCSVQTPVELATIQPKPAPGKRFRHFSKATQTFEWISSALPDKIATTHLYHPVKPLELHKLWRMR